VTLNLMINPAMPDPLRCPFCGQPPLVSGEVSHTSDDHQKWGAIMCPTCGAQGPDVRTGWKPFAEWAEDAIARWNKRVP